MMLPRCRREKPNGPELHRPSVASRRDAQRTIYAWMCSVRGGGSMRDDPRIKKLKALAPKAGTAGERAAALAAISRWTRTSCCRWRGLGAISTDAFPPARVLVQALKRSEQRLDHSVRGLAPNSGTD
jgi:hypothetical protein